MKKEKLKPVIYTTSYYPHGAQNETQQLVLLKALQITNDPKELRKMMGVRTVTEVYRTLDKLSTRKEYTDALSRAGLDMDFIVNGLKKIASEGFKDSDRLSALKTILQSLGLDKYEADPNQGGGTWEEELLKITEAAKKERDLLGAGEKIYDVEIEDYEVKQPIIPESVKKQREEEAKLVEGIYG
jgi:hypothetical protein